jgi:hypothetical protein
MITARDCAKRFGTTALVIGLVAALAPCSKTTEASRPLDQAEQETAVFATDSIDCRRIRSQTRAGEPRERYLVECDPGFRQWAESTDANPCTSNCCEGQPC